MIYAFEGDSADAVWRDAYHKVTDPETSTVVEGRGGETRELLHSLLLIRDPRNRWVVSRLPSLNPAFAIAEVVWILRGRNDLAFLAHWNHSLCRFVGESKSLHGAYGYRLRQHFGIDQLSRAASALTCNSESRQIVLQIWDSTVDLPQLSGSPSNADIPCNISSMLKIRGGKLEWTQVMRSNDLFRGLPYNIVQFTMLQEVLAGWIGVEVGSYVQLSDSLHVYTEDQVSHAQRLSSPRADDSVALPTDESNLAWRLLEALIDRLRSDSLGREEVLNLIESHSLSGGFRNLASVLTAEECRRRHWFGECQSSLDLCSSDTLKQVAIGWFRERRTAEIMRSELEVAWL